MRIDAHQHYWRIERGDYGWITPDLPVLYRDFSPQDLLPHLKQHQLDGSIAVQAAPTLAETDYLLSLADTDDSILGVVGWLDLHDPEHRSHYERFSRHPKFVGFRIMIQEMPDASSILEPSFLEALSAYAAEDVPIDLLVVSHQLPPLVRLLERVPHLRGVIDHLAKPRIAEGATAPWLSYMREIAAHPKLYCKLSGMVTEADHRHWKQADFTFYIRQILELFGPQRVMFGSDWPVCLLAASYDQTMSVLQQAIPDSWSEQERTLLFGENARTFYKLNDVSRKLKEGERL
ncbi:amidohydrolase family protein [Paenibacillus hexagrammi]|uniref:Amidohydrolase family protein n=1 Tax=Paenibacillus hexagrammi TaxID=2908839 RepID=A0ABY3SEF1_9BACL|nr:amidohydrolase family protein [Paenibacillus sp. YPD9-1]UJF32374.1 amidohydrolase family protein [Paenibacillus sp. YPD9-1]